MDGQQNNDIDERMQDRIDKYVLGLMSDAERKAFEHDLDVDPELHGQYELTATVRDTLAERDEMRMKMERWKADGRRRRHGKKHLLVSAASVAAVLAAGAILFHAFYSPAYDCSVSDDFAVYRGGGDFQGIARLINAGEYDKALDRISSEERSLNSQSGLAIADSTDEEQAARIEYVRQATQHDRETVLWLKAHALMGKGDKAVAMSVLDSLRAGKGAYSLKADSLYRKWK